MDLTNPDTFADGFPHAEFARLRRSDPVHWHPESRDIPGFWVLSRYEDIKRVSKDPPAVGNPGGENADTRTFSPPSASD